MDKRIVTGIVIVVIIAVFGGLFFSLQNQKTSSSIIPTPQAISTQQAAPVSNATYTDDSGFSFLYPQNVTIAKQETKDPLVYSDLKLTSPGLLQATEVKVVDTKFTTPQQWIAQNAASLEVKDITLGKLSGKEVRSKDKIIAVAIDQGVLFTIESPKVHESIYNTIVSSFTFTPQAAVQNSNQTSTQVPADSQDDSVVEETVE